MGFVMLYSEFCALTDAARHTDVELTYKNTFTDFEFTIKATPAINGDDWLWLIRCPDEYAECIRRMLDSFDIVFYNPSVNKFIFKH